MTIQELRALYEAACARVQTSISAVEALPDDATEEQIRTRQTEFDEATAEAERTQGNLQRAEAMQRAREAHPAPEPRAGDAGDAASGGNGAGNGAGGLRVREPRTYRPDNRSVSYFRDLGLSIYGRGDRDVRERLSRHAREVTEDHEARERDSRTERDRAIEDLSNDPTVPASVRRQLAQLEFVEQRDLTRVDGSGGEAIPPLWLMDELITVLRAGRTTADLVRRVPLPGGTDSINIPRIATGTAVAIQASDNAAVNEVDATMNSISAPVRTIAGQQDLALQLIEQSPLMFDELILADLTADYDLKLDVQVISGAGSAGTLTGFLSTAGITTVAFTDVTPTVPELWPKLADTLNQSSTNRLLPPTAWVMHPRRWWWMVAALDAQLRPFITWFPNNPTNALATVDDIAAQGPVGMLLGLPVYLDPMIPTNIGAGTNEDIILAVRWNDAVLFEGAIRTRALPEVLSGTLTVRLQLYAYSAFTAARYPSGVVRIQGTGLVPPTF